MHPEVLIREVGPRDGFQNEDRTIPTELKVDYIEMLAAAGVPWMEVTSFVSPKWVPQLADAADVVAALAEKDLGETEIVAFVPNLRGLERAAECGVTRVTTALTVSDELNRNNFNKDTDAMLASLPALLAASAEQNVEIEVTIGTAFGDLGDRTLTVERVIEVTEAVASMGVSSITLGDTVGVGNPRRVEETFRRLHETLPGVIFGAHFHDTRGLGIANVWAAWGQGVRMFDSSYGGLGGCPFAPGSSGNVATETLVYMFEEAGIRTGIDLGAIMLAAIQTTSFLDKSLSLPSQTMASDVGAPRG
jgi:hydroxymethylglutaryl-CoA lyase